MQLITANLFCFNPWQRAAIQQLLASPADVLILPEVKPTLVSWVRENGSDHLPLLVRLAVNH